MATFTPPTDDFHGLSDFDLDTMWSQETRLAYRLLRHYRPLPRGRNVYKLDDGSYVESEPADMATVVVSYYGGHSYDVDATEEAALVAAGYGEYIE